MTFRLRTCSRAGLLGAACAAWAAAATVSGQVQIRDSRVSAVARSRNYEDVAVWLEPANGKAPAPPAQVHRVLQKNKRFTPHVSVIGVGSTVDFPNLDPIFHNAFSNFAGQPFDTGLYPPGGTQKVRFQREGVVRVFCNIHSAMSAVIVVVDTPWFGVSKRDGSFSIDNVPPGEYVLKVWHERAAAATLEALQQRITVAGPAVTAAAVVVSESGYTPVPHLNKYGKEYGPEPPARGGYPGGAPRP